MIAAGSLSCEDISYRRVLNTLNDEFVLLAICEGSAVAKLRSVDGCESGAWVLDFTLAPSAEIEFSSLRRAKEGLRDRLREFLGED